MTKVVLRFQSAPLYEFTSLNQFCSHSTYIRVQAPVIHSWVERLNKSFREFTWKIMSHKKDELASSIQPTSTNGFLVLMSSKDRFWWRIFVQGCLKWLPCFCLIVWLVWVSTSWLTFHYQVEEMILMI